MQVYIQRNGSRFGIYHVASDDLIAGGFSRFHDAAQYVIQRGWELVTVGGL